MSTLNASAKSLSESLCNSDVIESFGFTDVALMGCKKLIELSGNTVRYYDFGLFLVLENSNKGEAARMQADKGVKCYFEDRDLTVYDFMNYNRLINRNKK